MQLGGQAGVELDERAEEGPCSKKVKYDTEEGKESLPEVLTTTESGRAMEGNPPELVEGMNTGDSSVAVRGSEAGPLPEGGGAEGGHEEGVADSVAAGADVADPETQLQAREKERRRKVQDMEVQLL